jgi:hypothetical protein
MPNFAITNNISYKERKPNQGYKAITFLVSTKIMQSAKNFQERHPLIPTQTPQLFVRKHINNFDNQPNG